MSMPPSLRKSAAERNTSDADTPDQCARRLRGTVYERQPRAANVSRAFRRQVLATGCSSTVVGATRHSIPDLAQIQHFRDVHAPGDVAGHAVWVAAARRRHEDGSSVVRDPERGSAGITDAGAAVSGRGNLLGKQPELACSKVLGLTEIVCVVLLVVGMGNDHIDTTCP